MGDRTYSECEPIGWEGSTLITRTRDLEEASRAISRVYCPYRFSVSGSSHLAGQAEMFSLSGHTIDLSRFAYGVPIDIEPCAFEDFYLVLTTTRGHAEISDGKTMYAGGAGMTVVANPECSWRFRYSGTNMQSVVRIPASRIAEIGVAIWGGSHQKASAPAGRIIDSALQQRWNLLVDNLRILMGPSISISTRKLLLPRAEELLLATLLSGQGNEPDTKKSGPLGGPLTLRRALAHIDENLDQPLTLEGIANAALCSIRSLQRVFRDWRGLSVMQYVREQRLMRVYEELRYEAATRSVTEVATRWGFMQLGQFAADYRNRFGELPSQTLRRR